MQQPSVSPLPGDDPAGHLATGWEPHRPLSDGLVRRFVYAYASSFAGPVALLGGNVIRREAFVAWDRGHPSAFFNGAMLLQPLPYAGWGHVLDEIEAVLSADGTGEVVLFCPWPTPDLTTRGWILAGHPPLLLRPVGLPASPALPWLEIVEVIDRRTLADWEHVVIEGYPFDELRPARARTLVDERVLTDPHLHAWVGYAGDEPVAVGTSYLAHGCNVFAMGVTLPEYRGRGAWHALARQRLVRFPASPAMALFSDHSRPSAENLGFLPISRWTVWLRARDGT